MVYVLGDGRIVEDERLRARSTSRSAPRSASAETNHSESPARTSVQTGVRRHPCRRATPSALLRPAEACATTNPPPPTLNPCSDVQTRPGFTPNSAETHKALPRPDYRHHLHLPTQGGGDGILPRLIQQEAVPVPVTESAICERPRLVDVIVGERRPCELALKRDCLRLEQDRDVRHVLGHALQDLAVNRKTLQPVRCTVPLNNEIVDVRRCPVRNVEPARFRIVRAEDE